MRRIPQKPNWLFKPPRPLKRPTPNKNRLRRLSPILLLLLGLVAPFLLLLNWFWVEPGPRAHALLLWATQHDSANIPPLPFWKRDWQALAKTGLFSAQTGDAYPQLTSAQIRQKLKELRPIDETIVVWLAMPSRCTKKGRVYLLPDDADPQGQSTWISLREVLGLLGNCRSKKKLLILDITPPPVESEMSLLRPDVAQAAGDEIKKTADPHLLVLSSCSVGQDSLFLETMGRSLFAYYVDRGLRGDADGFRKLGNVDKKITVTELAAYVRDRTNRCAQLVCGCRQTPRLIGKGGDFVVYKSKGTHADSKATGEPSYPARMEKAWRSLDSVIAKSAYRRSMSSVRSQCYRLLLAESWCRRGVNAEQINSKLRTEFEKLQLSTTISKRTEPAPHSLSQIRKRDEKKDGPQGKLTLLAGKIDYVSHAFAKDDSAALRAQLVASFFRQAQEESFDEIAQTVFARMAKSPQTNRERILLLAGLLGAIQAEDNSSFLETVLMKRLAATAKNTTTNEWPAAVAAKLVQTAAKGEEATRSIRAFRWNEHLLEKAAQLRHEGEMTFWARGFAAPAAADKLLQKAESQYDRVLQRVEIIDRAAAGLDRATWFLPFYLPYLTAHPQQENRWLEVVKTTTLLFDVLLRGPATSAEADDQIQEIQKLAAYLNQEIKHLERPFRPEEVERLIAQSEVANASAQQITSKLRAVLKTPFVSYEDRQKLRAAAWRLEQRLWPRMNQEDAANAGRAAAQNVAATAEPVASISHRKQRSVRYAKHVLGLFHLAGLAKEKIDALKKQFGQATSQDAAEIDWYAFTEKLRHTWQVEFRRQYRADPSPAWRDRLARFLPPNHDASIEVTNEPLDADRARMHDGKLLWKWLANRFSYQAHAYRHSGLPDGHDLVFADFFEHAAGGYAAHSELAIEDYIQLRSQGAVPALASSRRQVQFKMLMRHLAKQKNATNSPIAVEFSSPAKENLFVFPSSLLVDNRRQIAAPPPGKTYSFTLQVGYPNLENSSAHRPSGFLAAARAGGRSYHRCVRVPTIRVGVVKVLLSRNRAKPKPALDSLDLPVDDRSQEMFVFIENTGAKPFAAQVQVKHKNTNNILATAFLKIEPKRTARASLRSLKDSGSEAIDLDGGLRVFVVDRNDPSLVLADKEVALSWQAVVGADRPAVRLQTKKELRPQSRWTVPVEVQSAPPGARLEVRLGRREGTSFLSDVIKSFPSARERRVTMRVDSRSGCLRFAVTSNDWRVRMDTRQILGSRQLLARLVDEDGRVVAEAAREVVIDETPPVGVRFLDAPLQVGPSKEFTVRATGIDPESGIKQVDFFFGKMENGAIPAHAKFIPGIKVKGEGAAWKAKLKMPDKAKGTVSVTVVMSNALDLQSFETTEIDIAKPKPAPPRTGDIKGRVMQGRLPQPFLEVFLIDPAGRTVAATQTNVNGVFEFQSVPPGRYRVYSRKRGSGRQGHQDVEVFRGKTSKALVFLVL